MNIHPSAIGIDISKHTLDLFDTRTGGFRRIENTSQAIGGWLDALEETSCLVVFEATGPYDKTLTRHLCERGLRAARVNPSQARNFARASGRLAKTDRLDAKVLAHMGCTMDLKLIAPPDVARERLKSLVSRRDQLIDMRVQEKNRRTDEAQAVSLTQHIDWLDREIKAFEDKIADLIKTTPSLKAQNKLLQSIPGIGPVAAMVLLSQMTELGQATRRSIAALAGLAPINRDSGTMRGKRIIQAGRARVRRALYMAALTAARSKTLFKTFYDKLVENGKPKKVALIALARKMLTVANAIIKSGQPYKA